MVTDFLCRKQLREGDLILNQEIFNLISKRWGLPEVDLFASRANAKTLFLLLKQVGRRTRGGCANAELVFQKMLCLPDSGLAAGSVEKILNREHLSDLGATTLAQKGLVLDPQTVSSRTSLVPPTPGGSPITGTGPLSPSTSMEPSGLATEEGLLKTKGFPERLISTLLNSRKKETCQMYKKLWVRFHD